MNNEFATLNSTASEIRDIFTSTKTIAIIGCSPNPSKASNVVASFLQNHGYKIVPVYPKEETILGQKVYRSLSEIPFKVDMVDIFRKPKEIALIVESAIKRGDIDTIWTQLDLVNNEACEVAVKAGIAVVQDKCTKIEYAKYF